MSRSETVTSPQTPGAGRRFSYTYPSNGLMSIGSNPGGTDITPRPNGIPSQSYWGSFPAGATPSPQGAQIYNGRAAWALTSDAGSSNQLSPSFAGTNRPLVMPFQLTKGPADLSNIDDFACWSVSAILAFDAMTGPVTGDIGVAVGSGTRCVIRGVASLFAGLEIGPTGIGTIGVIVRQVDGGAVTFAANCPYQPDMTNYNLYEIRLIGPTATQEAQVKFLLNGRQQFALSYGAGTLLPDQVIAASSCGFTPGLINNKATAGTSRMYLPVNGLTVQSAPTEDALL